MNVEGGVFVFAEEAIVYLPLMIFDELNFDKFLEGLGWACEGSFECDVLVEGSATYWEESPCKDHQFC